MEKDIVILVGASSTGKDTILNKLVEDYGFHKMVSYTTRNIRPKEVDGKDYHFTDNETFDKLWEEGELFEKTEYQNVDNLWQYGLGMKSIEEGKVNVTILNPSGLEQIMKSPLADRVVSFLIKTPIETRYKRYGERLGREMTVKEKCEAWDRLGRDLEDFENFSDCDFTLCNKFNSDVDSIASRIFHRTNDLNREADNV